MSSKSVLLLGIVFIFLLNVIAVHNYIDNYYYQTEDTNLTKIELTPDLVVLDKLSKESKTESTVTPKVDKTKEKSSIKKVDEELIKYKSYYANEIKEERKSWNKLFTKREQTKTKKVDNLVEETPQNALIVLNLNIKDKFVPNNPIIKKIAKKLDKNKVIKIKIYKYSIKLKDYLEKIKYDFAEQGVDIDDIEVIYNKNEDKKNKIKILLVKKD